ncbi:MAG: prepilin-type N-terminal cleavage/methylation domain-containing protein [Bryobacterales bacterium]|nr:prepilin-type N-terminal cleavage/methylation domain-containing protein [Bryobacteraceae bacterium]MDW8354435.1 prepilin-type N-terminal cleavage/methylation domain-containing protein [Bryobacterales bacterium]
MRARGYTLLEMLVATLILGVTVAGLLSNLSLSLRTASKVADYDRAAFLAKRKMDELLSDSRLHRFAALDGPLDPAIGLEGGWRVRVEPFEAPAQARPGTPVLDRIVLELWWRQGSRTRRLQLEAFRRSLVEIPGTQP